MRINTNAHHSYKQTLERRVAKLAKYTELKNGVEPPGEIFQTDCMSELLSGIDSSDVPVVAALETDTAASLVAKREAQVAAAQRTHLDLLAARANFSAQDALAKVPLWEVKKPAFRSELVS